jgi:hypothetical protein
MSRKPDQVIRDDREGTLAFRMGRVVCVGDRTVEMINEPEAEYLMQGVANLIERLRR